MTGLFLDLPGVRLHHELRGAGPLLVLIPGGSGDAGGFAALASQLAGRRTVLMYDRRGYSRSIAAEPPPPGGRLSQDVADAVALLDEYSPDAPAEVLGSSSGAVVGLHLLASYPDRIARLVAHEPPLVDLLPDVAELRAFLEQVRDTAGRKGIRAAMRVFGRRVDVPEPPDELISRLPAEVAEMLARMATNRPVWVRNELVQYPTSMPDLPVLQRHSARLLPAFGADSRDEFPARSARELAARLDVEALMVPGNHVGFVDHAAEFAAALEAAGATAQPGPTAAGRPNAPT